MGFLQRRIDPRLDESEEQAFKRLLDANELECEGYPWDAKQEFRVRDKTANINLKGRPVVMEVRLPTGE